MEAALRTLLEGRLAGRPAVLLVSAGQAAESGWGAEASIQFATAAVRLGRRAMLVDANPGAASLHGRLGVGNEEGLTEAVVLGLPLATVSHDVDGFQFVSAGAEYDPAEVLAYEGWAGLLDDAARNEILLLLAAPAGTPGLEALARTVGVAIVLAGPDAPRETWGLPRECRVLAALAPSAAPARPRAVAPPAAPIAAAEPATAPSADVVPAQPLAPSASPAPAPSPAEPAASVVADAPIIPPAAVDQPAAVDTVGAEDRVVSIDEAAPVDRIDAVDAVDAVHPVHQVDAVGAVDPIHQVDAVDAVAALPDVDAVGPAEVGAAAPADAADARINAAESVDTADRVDVDQVATAPAISIDRMDVDDRVDANRVDAVDVIAPAHPADVDALHLPDTIDSPRVDALHPAETIDSPRGADDVETGSASGAAPSATADKVVATPGVPLASRIKAALKSSSPVVDDEPATATVDAAQEVTLGIADAEPAAARPVSAAEILRAAEEAEAAAVAELEPAIIDDAPTPVGIKQQKGKRSRRRRETGTDSDASSRYVVPRQAGWREWLIRAQAVVTLVMWTYYIVWRWGWTLNPDALWFSIPLALAETWGLIAGFLFVHSVWKLNHRTPSPAPPGLSVDVFVTCYDEPLEVIRRTAVGAHSIRYPHRTWVLDDGKRDEVRAMAAEIGVGYLRRPGNAHAKAGNLNHGLEHTTGEYVLVLDADHVPLPHMLDQMLGFLAADSKLAFVQSPQDFYNTDAFTYDVDEAGRRMWEEQRLFFSVLQPGKDSRNAAFFCGSAAVLRRAALNEIGGFSHHSITEDIETSLRLHARGWKSAFYGESLAYGLAAGSAAAFHTQHLRWGQGAMQVMKKYNPLLVRGLSLSQRLSYFASLTAYVGGLQKLVFLLAPLLFFLTGVLPVRALNLGFLARFLPVLAMTLIMSVLLSRGLSHLWISERYHVAKFWTYTRAVASVFLTRPLRFRVTPKGPGHVPFRTYAPQVVLMAVSMAAVGWSLVALDRGWVDYGWEGTRSPGYLANLVWLAFNFVLASSVVQLSLRIRQQRSDHRFRDQFPIQVSVRGQDGSLHTSVALTENLNPGGIAFRTGEPLRGGGEARLTLGLTTGVVQVRARVVHCARVEGTDPPMYRTGASFVDVPVAVRDAIELHCTQHSVPLEQSRYRTALRFLQRAGEAVNNDRREPRRAVQLPAEVTLPRVPGEPAGEAPMAFLEDLSENGARLVMDRPVTPGTPIRFRVPGTSTERTGTVVFSRAMETPIGVRYAVGVAQTNVPPSRPGYARRSVNGLRAASRSLGI